MTIAYMNYLKSGVSTTPQTVYNPTTAGIQATVIGMLIANTSNTATTATVTLSDGVTTTSIVRNVPIPSGSTLSVLDASRLIVEQNNVLAVSANGTVDVTLSVIEVT